MATDNRYSGQSNGSKTALIARAVKLIFSGYRRDDFADADSFLMQLGVILEGYSEEVIMAVSHPRSGLQRRYDHPPTLKQCGDACEAEAHAIFTRSKYAALPPSQRIAGPRGEPCTYGEMTARHGRPIGRFERGTGFEQYAGRRTEGQRGEFKRLNVDDLRNLYPDRATVERNMAVCKAVVDSVKNDPDPFEEMPPTEQFAENANNYDAMPDGRPEPPPNPFEDAA